MSFTIPILIQDVVDCELPISLYRDNNFEFFLSEFPISERKLLFALDHLEINEKGATYSGSRYSILEKFPDFMYSKYRILIQTNNDSEEVVEQFHKFSIDLDFCCQLFFNYPTSLIIYGSYEKSENLIQSFKRVGLSTIINLKVINSFKNIFSICINNSPESNKRKLLFHSLLNITHLQSFNLGLVCSTYITILESIFTNENTEISYRFSMRISKYLKGDISLAKKIKKLYAMRSSYYHTGKVEFNSEEEIYLSNLTRQIIIDYLQTPERFEISKLDEELLL